MNCYLVGDILIDAGMRLARRSILAQLRGRRLKAHALTHAHGDHQGASHAVCERFDIPFWVGSADVAAAETGGRATYADMPQPLHPIPRVYSHIFPGPGHPVARALRQGDDVGGFSVLETPGHSAGHLAFWRASDRVLIAGDVFSTIDVTTLRRGLNEPKPYFTPDPVANRTAIRRLAALEPALVCVGHGPPLRDPEQLAAFAAALPVD